MTVDHTLLQTHLFAQIRDAGGSRMTICSQLEFCLMNSCIAVFEARSWDTHYGVKGDRFQLFAGQKLIRLIEYRYSYERHTELADGFDRFELSSYVFCALLQELYHHSREIAGRWYMVSADKELLKQLALDHLAFDPFALSFLASTDAERRIYS